MDKSRKSIRKYEHDKQRLLAEILAQSCDELDKEVDPIAIARQLKIDSDTAWKMTMEFVRADLLCGLGDGDGPEGASLMLTEAGKEEAEISTHTWLEVLWAEHSHAIVTGLFAIIAAILGAVVGAYVTYLLIRP